MSTTASTETAPRRRPESSHASQWMRAREAGQFLERPARDAKELLRRHGVPVIEHSERDWEVRRELVVTLYDRLEREAAEKLAPSRGSR